MLSWSIQEEVKPELKFGDGVCELLPQVGLDHDPHNLSLQGARIIGMRHLCLSGYLLFLILALQQFIQSPIQCWVEAVTANILNFAEEFVQNCYHCFLSYLEQFINEAIQASLKYILIKQDPISKIIRARGVDLLLCECPKPWVQTLVPSINQLIKLSRLERQKESCHNYLWITSDVIDKRSC
jgi:hypothetical protein